MNQNNVTIELLTKDKKKDYYKVETNIGEFLISESLIVKHLILKDKVFKEEEFKEIINEIAKEKYLSKTLNYISYQMRSEYEIKTYLIEKEANLEIIEFVLEKLKTLNYINDELLASNIFKECVAKSKGPKFLKDKLMKKKIETALIDNVCREYTEELQIELIEDLSIKYIEKNKNLPIKKQKEKLYTKLLYQGFDNYVINQFINKYQFVDDSDELLKKNLKQQINKYDKNLTLDAKRKIFNKLILKGFEYSKIKHYMNIFEDESNDE